MSLIVDASIAVKWVANEPGSEQARGLGAEGVALIAPDLLIAEAASALWKKCAQGILSRAQASAALDRLPDAFLRLVPLLDLSAPALELALDFKHPIYDCFYIALAQSEGAELVTADERMAAAAKKAKVKVRLI